MPSKSPSSSQTSANAPANSPSSSADWASCKRQRPCHWPWDSGTEMGDVLDSPEPGRGASDSSAQESYATGTVSLASGVRFRGSTKDVSVACSQLGAAASNEDIPLCDGSATAAGIVCIVSFGVKRPLQTAQPRLVPRLSVDALPMVGYSASGESLAGAKSIGQPGTCWVLRVHSALVSRLVADAAHRATCVVVWESGFPKFPAAEISGWIAD